MSVASAAGIIKIPAAEQVKCKAGSGTTTVPAQQCEGENFTCQTGTYHTICTLENAKGQANKRKSVKHIICDKKDQFNSG